MIQLQIDQVRQEFMGALNEIKDTNVIKMGNKQTLQLEGNSNMNGFMSTSQSFNKVTVPKTPPMSEKTQYQTACQSLQDYSSKNFIARSSSAQNDSHKTLFYKHVFNTKDNQTNDYCQQSTVELKKVEQKDTPCAK